MNHDRNFQALLAFYQQVGEEVRLNAAAISQKLIS